MQATKQKTKSRARARRRRRHFLAGTSSALRPPPRMSLSEWADEHFYLSPESAAEPGRWHTLPYQRGILDAITDPSVWRVSVMKAARVGYTKCIGAAIGYYLHQDPCPIMVVQPTVEDAEGFSKEEIAPMLRDCDALAALVKEPTAKISAQTILHKTFRGGGSLSLVGANSGRGFRRTSRRVVIFDEVDGYPASAGAEGDQIKLGIRRSEYYWNRKIVAGSTPLTAGTSRIEEMFESGDRRRFHVPCPHCGHRDFLVFGERGGGRGHWMQWPEGKPEEAHFVCSRSGCIIEETDKRSMLEAGAWIAETEFAGHASFHIWTAYSLSPNAGWSQIALEFLEAKKNPEQLKTFINTVLGETWREVGDVPDWEKLYLRREKYQIGTVPAAVRFLTAGVDVQKDRLIYEVVGWASSKESWSVEIGTLYGDTSLASTWAQLHEVLERSFPGPEDRTLSISMMAVDSGYNTQQVYAWTRRYPRTRVIACKGSATARDLVGTASVVDVTVGGKRQSRGATVRPVGVSIAKSELYGFLGLPLPPAGEPFPSGWCHFPEYDEGYFKQLTAEHLIKVRNRRGFTEYQWHVQVGRENHHLDCRVYARAAAAVLGLDRGRPPRSGRPRPAPTATAQRPPPIDTEEPSSARRARGGGSLFKRPRTGGGWFKPSRRR